MSFTATDFPGLFIFEPKVFEDNRGYFLNHIMKMFFGSRGSALNGSRITNPPPVMA
jgi:dTDP-4-dehydrorhamnose 3,5-epimerase-like enzyme